MAACMQDECLAGPLVAGIARKPLRKLLTGGLRLSRASVHCPMAHPV